MTTCLHLSNDFLGSSVHKSLYDSLAYKGIKQIVYVPYRRHLVGRLDQQQYPDYEVIPSKMVKEHHRLLFRSKIKFLAKDLMSKVNLPQVDIIYATTLFSDGALAYKLHRKYEMPYVLAIRDTDISVFLKYRQDLIPLAKKILKKASKVIFISHALHYKFLEHPKTKKLRSIIQDKVEVIYNGLNSYWLENRFPPKLSLSEPVKLVYVGRLVRRKNIFPLAKAVLEINEKLRPCKLVIAGYGHEEEDIKRLCEENPGIFEFRGRVKDKDELAKIYRHNDIFTMPASGETFGLVYLEALSQGLPVLYTKNEGIEGVFTEYIGKSCTTTYSGDIYQALKEIIEDFSLFNLENLDLSRFDWTSIGIRYNNLFESVMKTKSS